MHANAYTQTCTHKHSYIVQPLEQLRTYFNGSLDDGISNLGIQAIELFIHVSTRPLQVAKRMNHGKLHTEHTTQ